MQAKIASIIKVLNNLISKSTAPLWTSTALQDKKQNIVASSGSHAYTMHMYNVLMNIIARCIALYIVVTIYTPNY